MPEHVKLRAATMAKTMDDMLEVRDRFARLLEDGGILVTNHAAERAL